MLPGPQVCQVCSKFSGSHVLLPEIHPQLCQDSSPITSSDLQERTLHLVTRLPGSLPGAEGAAHHTSGVGVPKLRGGFRARDRCLYRRQLGQYQDDSHLHPISYASRGLNSSERNYGITELETLAVVWAISHFHHFLYGHKVKVFTDHTAVKAYW